MAVQRPYDFQFADRVEESGITFVHHTMDDAGLCDKPVHDGNGIAAAGVHGWCDVDFVN